jgi:hypothetical protein
MGRPVVSPPASAGVCGVRSLGDAYAPLCRSPRRRPKGEPLPHPLAGHLEIGPVSRRQFAMPGNLGFAGGPAPLAWRAHREWRRESGENLARDMPRGVHETGSTSGVRQGYGPLGEGRLSGIRRS